VEPKSPPPPDPNGTRPAPGPGTGLGLTLVVLLIGAGMFTLGVYVGRETLPIHFDIDQLNRHLDLFRQGVRKENEEAQVYRQAVEDATKLGFHEALKNPGAASMEDKGFVEPPPEKEAPQASQAPAAPVAAEAKAKAPPPAPVPAQPPSGGKLVIQVASVQDNKAAEQMVAKLQAQGLPAYWVAGEVAGKGTWYRVRVGNYATKAEAAEALERMTQTNLKGMILEVKSGGQ